MEEKLSGVAGIWSSKEAMPCTNVGDGRTTLLLDSGGGSGGGTGNWPFGGNEGGATTMTEGLSTRQLSGV